MGALGVALGTMVANLSSHKRGWDDRWEEFSSWAEKGRKYQEELMYLIDEDTSAFNRIMEAFAMPKKSDEEKEKRQKAVMEATKYATQVPFRIMETAYRSLEVIKAMVETGIPASVTDAGVGALAVRSCVMGAFLNVKINAADIDDKKFVDDIISKGEEIQEKTIKEEKEILEIVSARI